MWSYIVAIAITGGALFGAFKLGDQYATNRIEAAQQKVRADAFEKSAKAAPSAQAIAEQYAKSVSNTVLAQLERQHASTQAAINSGLDRCIRDAGVRESRNQAIKRTHPSAKHASASAATAWGMFEAVPAVAAGSGQ